jgi:hypothetical protein
VESPHPYEILLMFAIWLKEAKQTCHTGIHGVFWLPGAWRFKLLNQGLEPCIPDILPRRNGSFAHFGLCRGDRASILPPSKIASDFVYAPPAHARFPSTSIYQPSNVSPASPTIERKSL